MTLQLFTQDRVEVPVTMSTFPGGEEYVRIGDLPEGTTKLVLEARLTSSTEVMRYLMLEDAMLMTQIGRGQADIRVLMPYMPYARQDRICRPGESFSLDVFHRMQRANPICVDLHSPVAQEGAHPMTLRQVEVFEQVYNQFDLAAKNFTFVAPDKGAKVKTQQAANLCNRPVAFCEKIRDPNDPHGAVIGIGLASGDVKGKDCLIIDDICDGGRTFLETAKALKNSGAKSVSLYVTHGIFSAGLGVFVGVLDTIYTTNSFCPKYVGEFNTDAGHLSVHTFDAFKLLWEKI